MTEITDSASRLWPETYSPTHHKRRKRRLWTACICCLISILLVGLILLILALTVFKVKEPRFTLNSVVVEGISPSITFPLINVNLNISLDTDISVYNPNYASFSNDPGKAFLFYQGIGIGDVDVAAGNIPSRRWVHVYCKLTLEADRLTNKLGTLVGEVMVGKLGLDVSTRMSGQFTLLGFIKHHAVAIFDCHLVVGFPDLKVLDQQCTQSVKL